MDDDRPCFLQRNLHFLSDKSFALPLANMSTKNTNLLGNSLYWRGGGGEVDEFIFSSIHYFSNEQKCSVLPNNIYYDTVLITHCDLWG